MLRYQKQGSGGPVIRDPCNRHGHSSRRGPSYCLPCRSSRRHRGQCDRHVQPAARGRGASGRALRLRKLHECLRIGATARAPSERDPTAPDQPYGAAKRMVELVGESLSATQSVGFVSLRIARVVGPGARSTASSWRSEIFEATPSPEQPPITMPFAPSARLSLVHVDEVARMLMLLAETAELPAQIYNRPAEVWEAQQLAELVHRARQVPVHRCATERYSRVTSDFG